MQPLVSVITAIYNLIKAGRKEAFCRAVDSVQNQTYSNIEHIIIDGASNDGTLDLLRPYEQSGKLTVYSEPDTGIYNAMNKGLARAKKVNISSILIQTTSGINPMVSRKVYVYWKCQRQIFLLHPILYKIKMVVL